MLMGGRPHALLQGRVLCLSAVTGISLVSMCGITLLGSHSVTSWGFRARRRRERARFRFHRVGGEKVHVEMWARGDVYMWRFEGNLLTSRATATWALALVCHTLKAKAIIANLKGYGYLGSGTYAF